jgi:uncharacterized protein (TIGR00255 family)
MTGFGRVSGAFEGRGISVELKSVNSKQFDLSCKFPSRYREMEPTIKELVRTHVVRGKVELFINSELPERTLSMNADSINSYYQELSEIRSRIAPNEQVPLLPIVMRMPDVTSFSKEELSDEETSMILGLVKEACEQLDKFRKNEGVRIETDMEGQVHTILDLLEQVSEMDMGRGERIKEKLKLRLKEVEVEIDTNRFEQELIYYLERLDVNEEKVRLKGHCDFYKETLLSDSISKGKKLGFITQEMGREINTLGSKANDAGIQHHVVQMKENLEMLKEQVLNVL